MTQTYALLMDAYRELNAKKLFWITLVLSAIVAGAFFLIGLTDTGLKIGFWEFDESILGISNKTTDPGEFYKWIFSDLAIRFWLGIAAAALALISTASFFPDIMKPGAIDLLLTKPISRLRLFITRYVLGLIFALLQVLVFTTICFLVIGIRGGVWEPGLFLAVPFFVLFFSYLFAFSVLIGVLTRSTIAALLITLLFFVLLIGLNMADSITAGIRLAIETRAQQLAEQVELAESLEPEQLEKFEQDYMPLEWLRQEADEAKEISEKAGGVSNTFMAIKTPLPKTGETLAMLTRVTIDAAGLPEPEPESGSPMGAFDNQMRSDSEIMQEKAEELERPAWWVIGTSLGFEFVVLAIAGWRFCRRDY